MKITLATLLICLLISCGKKQLNNDIIDSPIKTGEITKVKKETKPDIEKILNEYLPKVEACAKKDSVFYPLGYTEMIEDTVPLLAIGRFIDKEKIYAVNISSADDATLTFYCYQNKKWEIIGTNKASMDVLNLEFKDFDGDNRNEILTSGHGNMNGNNSNDFYYCSPKTNTVNFAGSFFCRFDDSQIDKKNKTIKTEYYGSWYANSEKTLYKWSEGYLVAQKQVVIGLKNDDGKHSAQFIEYYESPNPEIDSLVLKFRKTYRESDKKLNNLWEHFFD